MNTPQTRIINGKSHQLAMQLRHCVISLVLIIVCPLSAPAQQGHTHEAPELSRDIPAEQKAKASALIEIVRRATERFKDVAVAEAEGYKLQFGCVTGSDSGAMGLHYVNSRLVGEGELDAARPHIVIYEPAANGRLQLTGADYLLIADAWNAKHKSPPELMGQLFHLFETPNRFGLPAFYTLHVWAWKDNPNGAFVNWHPKVSCDSFAATNP
jgi:hypothetical protein